MCVDLSNFSSSSSHGNTTRIGSKVLYLCGSTDQKLAYFLPNLLPSTDRKYIPTDWTLDRKLTVKRCIIYLMASNMMIEEMLLQEGINKRKKWMKKDLKQFTPDVKCLCSFLIMI